MAGINKAILIGRLGRDPEVRRTPSGQSVANFSIATSESYTDKNGQRQERTEWHNVVAWGKTAELAGQYLKKGRQVYVEGRISTRSWDDKDGNKKYKTEIVVNQLQFLGGASDSAGGGDYRNSSQNQGNSSSDAHDFSPSFDQGNEPPQNDFISDDDLPF